MIMDMYIDGKEMEIDLPCLPPIGCIFRGNTVKMVNAVEYDFSKKRYKIFLA